ncbi:SAM hydrolase/SAM-dependent halogenase family protein [Terrimonas ferruginea]|uniref:SAM hydrolase/SAM-dependent halogenase family protein n=1 Tax=Terrimonas ferruginea TaxID=249 RepID=UPI00048AAB5C|nr:S-adenosyl-l-methionine hydroxide adenosyltransferase family protein [Terrimonas ferruginea]
MKYLLVIILLSFISCTSPKPHNALVLQTDFGTKDGAVAAMRGVARGVDANLDIFDLTHEIPAYNIWEAAYRLHQSVGYWPTGTVFVSVVDPGVGSERKSVVARLKSGVFIVTPDNGTLTLLVESPGIEAIRQIDEKINRRQGSDSSYTFHGRDVYVYTAARLAAGVISFEETGPLLQNKVVALPYQKAVKEDAVLSGMIPVLDIQYGNVWTNIPDSLVSLAGIQRGDTLLLDVFHKDSLVFTGKLPMAHTFADVAEGQSLAYLNSLMNLSFAVNQGSFAEKFKVGSGNEWRVKIQPFDKLRGRSTNLK